MKPYAQSCENNKYPILEHLENFFSDRKNILEIGSGTGQHAVCFAEAMKYLQWQCGDLPENHAGIMEWVKDSGLSNIVSPVNTNAELKIWDFGQFDGVFSANTLHIMSWDNVQKLFQHIDSVLNSNGKLAIYGPFNYEGRFTSDSNAQFDDWLKQRAAHQGIRDFEKVNQLAKNIGLQLIADNAMPANNRLLFWQKN